MKFRRGLNLEISDAVATMAASRPSDLDPEAWYEAAVRTDQNKAMNAAFQHLVGLPEAHQTLYHELETAEDEPRFSDVVSPPALGPDVLDIKDMSADDIRSLLQRLSAPQCIDKSSPSPPKKARTPAPPEKKPSAHPPNRYQTLTVEEAPDTTADASAGVEATCAKQPRRPRWERCLLLAPEIGAACKGDCRVGSGSESEIKYLTGSRN